MPTAPTSMTSQQRMKAAIAGEPHDRVPRFDQLWPETLERWRSEGLTGDVADVFGFDLTWLKGHFRAPPFPGREDVVSEDEQTRVTINQFGATVRQWKTATGVPEHLGWECADPDVWRDHYLPRFAPEKQRLSPEQIDETAQSLQAARERGQYTCTTGHSTFEALRAMLGDETMLMAMAAEPEWIKEISRVYNDAMIAKYRQVFDAGVLPDAMWTFEDLAYTSGPFCSPAMYRELIWPDHKRLCDLAHEYGLQFIFHTDGDIRSFMDPLIEAGVDCLQPLEAKANVDVRELAPRYGDRVAFFGNIDMIVAATNDTEKVTHEVVSKLEAGMACGRYLYHSDHSVPPTVSFETYRLIHHLLDEHGWY